MADTVNLTFGGSVAATWETLQGVVQAYRDLADAHELIKRKHGFTLIYDETNELVSIDLWYEKLDLLESGLQTFLDGWKAIAAGNGISRYQTTINYVEDIS